MDAFVVSVHERTKLVLWRSPACQVRDRYQAANPTATVQEINRLAGTEWKSLPAADRAYWDVQAQEGD